MVTAKFGTLLIFGLRNSRDFTELTHTELGSGSRRRQPLPPKPDNEESPGRMKDLPERLTLIDASRREE